MSSLTLNPVSVSPALSESITAACARIAPLWPLRHFVAVNPFLGVLERPFPKACEVLEQVTGAAPLLSPADYLALERQGQIAAADLAEAGGARYTVDELRRILQQEEVGDNAEPLATFADLLDAERPRSHWGNFIVEEISKWCVAAFDESQSTWQSPWRSQGLYAGWREGASQDCNPEVFGLKGFREFVSALPMEPEAAISVCLEKLATPPTMQTDFLHRQLATIAGWAGFVQYRVREASLRGRTDSSLRELLAIRLAYDAALASAFKDDPVIYANRSQSPHTTDRSALLEARVRWQRAYEYGYQRQLAGRLRAATVEQALGRPQMQAVFCIDVRSEVLRRHLEAAAPVQTIGFAGFFGFSIAHRTAGKADAPARCPVLLVPTLETVEAPVMSLTQDRDARGAWLAFQNSAISCFTYVESTGLAYAPALGQGPSPARPSCARSAPRYAAEPDLATRVQMAAGALRGMSWGSQFARLVLLCGHGAQTANNPYASSLDCGACGGHAGDVNARVAVAVFNDPAVRAGLAARGVVIPEDTVFIAGLHNTTTDDVVLFDEAQVPASHTQDLAALRDALAKAGAAARAERARSLDLEGLSTEKLARMLRMRAADPAQTRPEWGLANNAAFIAARRSRTKSLALDGRVFLHDYDASLDRGDQVLTLILSAPVVVASWINLQYYASRVDPVRYGAGNKVLHNVAGGLGAFEGNGGDLKVGLPLQSVHDGEKFMHEPRRLTVFVETTRERLQAVLNTQPSVRVLFDNGWIYLVAWEGIETFRYTPEGWKPLN
jgi:uncharacterized protein